MYKWRSEIINFRRLGRIKLTDKRNGATGKKQKNSLINRRSLRGNEYFLSAVGVYGGDLLLFNAEHERSEAHSRILPFSRKNLPNISQSNRIVSRWLGKTRNSRREKKRQWRKKNGRESGKEWQTKTESETGCRRAILFGWLHQK